MQCTECKASMHGFKLGLCPKKLSFKFLEVSAQSSCSFIIRCFCCSTFNNLDSAFFFFNFRGFGSSLIQIFLSPYYEQMPFLSWGGCPAHRGVHSSSVPGLYLPRVGSTSSHLVVTTGYVLWHFQRSPEEKTERAESPPAENHLSSSACFVDDKSEVQLY